MSNYIICGHSAIGKFHENRGLKCQDNNLYAEKDNIAVAAVADGLSSSKNSDIASKTAVEYIVKYCFDNLNMEATEKKIIDILKKGFDKTKFKIEQKAGDALNDYDTTLTVAVLIGEDLYYGQIGDSGIIALCEDGKFERVTEAQNGEGVGKSRPVFPLAASEKWVFQKYEKKIKAVFLATDGVLNRLQPPLLEKQKYTLIHSYLTYVFGNVCKSYQKSEDELKNWISNEVEKELKPIDVCYDDKTLLVVINKDAKLNKQPNEYYKYPSEDLWAKLKRDAESNLKSNQLSVEPKKKNENYPTKKIDVDSLPQTYKTISQPSPFLSNAISNQSLAKDLSGSIERNPSKKQSGKLLIVALIIAVGLCIVGIIYLLIDMRFAKLCKELETKYKLSSTVLSVEQSKSENVISHADDAFLNEKSMKHIEMKEKKQASTSDDQESIDNSSIKKDENEKKEPKEYTKYSSDDLEIKFKKKEDAVLYADEITVDKSSTEYGEEQEKKNTGERAVGDDE